MSHGDPVIQACFYRCGNPVVGTVRGWDVICRRPREIPFCERHRQTASQHAREHKLDLDGWDRAARRTKVEIREEYEQSQWERREARR